MKYQINEMQNGVDVRLDEVGRNQKQLLEAFQACREGRCACPTGEYRKLESIEIEQAPDRITLHLRSKPGEKLEKTEIIRCLEITKGSLE